MVIILPETKIKGRTGWTESVAANSYMEPERWLGAWAAWILGAAARGAGGGEGESGLGEHRDRIPPRGPAGQSRRACGSCVGEAGVSSFAAGSGVWSPCGLGRREPQARGLSGGSPAVSHGGGARGSLSAWAAMVQASGSANSPGARTAGFTVSAPRNRFGA